MTVDLEDRLERLATTLPEPTPEVRERARSTALAALPPEPRRRGRRAALLAAVGVAGAAAAVLALLAAPWGDNPLATERALAALGDQPVIHAIVEQPASAVTVIDLDSGSERQAPHHSEYWYDDERDLLRVRLSVGGRILPGGEFVQSPEGFFTDRGSRRDELRPPRIDPALAGFASRYRDALERGEATEVGEEVVDGRQAVILRFSLPTGPLAGKVTEEVAVDADDFRPLRFRFGSSARPGEVTPWSQALRVIAIETIPRDPDDFARPEPADPRPAGQTGVGERTLTPTEAATALGRPAFWPGRTVHGVELTEIALIRVTTSWTDGSKTESRTVSLQYGADPRTAALEGKAALSISEGTSHAEMLSAGPLGSAPTGPGELRLRGLGDAGSGVAVMWFGSMQREGVYMSFRSPQRELIVAAAKAMVPLR
jgi:hypothetical protein